MNFPEPVICGLDRAQDQGRPGEALAGARQADAGGPDLPRPHRPDTGQTLISGMGELHLEIITDRLVREFNVDANVGKPQVAYQRDDHRARPRARAGSSARPAAAASTATARSASGRPAEGRLRLQQRDRRRRRSRASSSSRSSRGIKEALETGPLAGYPLTGDRGRPLRRQLPRRRLLGDRVQDRRLDGASRTPPSAPTRCCSSR